MSIHLRRARWFAFAGVALASIGIGFTGAKILANETIGYLAGYTWFGLMLVGVPFVLSLLVIGAILSFIPRTRWSGAVAVMAAVLIVASSFASFKILDALGQVLYKHEQMVPIGPDVQANLVVYFKPGITEEQISNFWKNVLSYSDPEGKGHYHRNGVRTIARVYPAFGGHEAVAVSFFANATQAQREEIKRDINASPIVFKVLENVAPADVKKL